MINFDMLFVNYYFLCIDWNGFNTWQMLKKDEDMTLIQGDLQECMKELTATRGILPKVTEERDLMWEEVKQYSERNMLLNCEVNLLKKKIESLDEDILIKEGQITILKDSIVNKPFDILFNSPTSVKEFTLQWNNRSLDPIFSFSLVMM